eukprot:6504380-Pyramimonas_sp.AAC.1
MERHLDLVCCRAGRGSSRTMLHEGLPIRFEGAREVLSAGGRRAPEVMVDRRSVEEGDAAFLKELR